ncbi:MAG: heparan-alpha-glucosaminide N-acetyltransferase domain-containing protein [Myxococcales bacterium]|jgi:hypothetical protein
MSAQGSRDPSVDWARGVASVIMIQGHAFHGWVSPLHKQSEAYLFTRIFATLPLPAFLVLAGAAVMYRVQAAAARGEAARELRAALVRRGLTVFLVGYLVNAAYALLDGWDGYPTFLRADVLQVIGLSIALLGGPCLRAGADGRLDPAGTVARAAGLGGLLTLLCPWATQLGRSLPLPWAAAAAPLVEVPGITQMPLTPLFAWCAAGAVAGRYLAATRHTRPRVRLLFVGAVALGLTWLGAAVADALAARLPGPVDRAHLAVIPNVLEYAGRGLLVLGAGALLSGWLPAAVQRVLTHFGRASLWAYVLHIPFCYGRPGEALRGQLDMAEAAGWVLLLLLGAYAAVWLRLHAARPAALRRRARAAVAVFAALGLWGCDDYRPTRSDAAIPLTPDRDGGGPPGAVSGSE